MDIEMYRGIKEQITVLEEKLKDLNQKRSEFESEIFSDMDVGDERVFEEFSFSIVPGRRSLSPKGNFYISWNQFVTGCLDDSEKELLDSLVKQQVIHKGPTLKQLETALSKSVFLQQHYDMAKDILNYSEGTPRQSIKIIENSINQEDILPGRHCFSKVVGMKFREKDLGHPLPYEEFHTGDELILKREPDNTYDRNAIRIYHKETDIFIGYIKSELAQTIAPIMDNGTGFSGRVTDITGGGELEHGINIELIIT